MPREQPNIVKPNRNAAKPDKSDLKEVERIRKKVN